mgnify:CR=1 FL=1|jgi:hypothetical protein
MNVAIHTSDCRKFKKMWVLLGGKLEHVRRTGELRYLHPVFTASVRANDRRADVPAVLLSRINHLLRMKAANDPVWDSELE